MLFRMIQSPNFYSHASCEARPYHNIRAFLWSWISTHTPLARRDLKVLGFRRQNIISTHTPLARRDLITSMKSTKSRISTHTPLARRDQSISHQFTCFQNFYSHASCEARLFTILQFPPIYTFLLTRLLRGATSTLIICRKRCTISTHTPLARRDSYNLIDSLPLGCISTHTPLARRDYCVTLTKFIVPISTHTPLARRD